MLHIFYDVDFFNNRLDTKHFINTDQVKCLKVIFHIKEKFPPAFFYLVCRLLQIFDIWGIRCNNHRIAFSKAIFFHNFLSQFQIVLIAKSGLTLPIIKRHKLPLKESR